MAFMELPHGMQKMSQIPFCQVQGRPAFIGFGRDLLPSISRCIYKILEASACNNEGKSLLYHE